MKSPDFTSLEEVDKILKINDVTIDETIVYNTDEYSYSMSWPHGTWRFPYKENELNKVKTHAALFVYLWLKDVGLPLSDELAYAYTKIYSTR